MNSLFLRLYFSVVATLIGGVILSVIFIYEYDYNREIDAFLKQGLPIYQRLIREQDLLALTPADDLAVKAGIYSSHPLALVPMPSDDTLFEYAGVFEGGKVVVLENESGLFEAYYPLSDSVYALRITEAPLPLKEDNYDQLIILFIFCLVGVIIFLLVYQINGYAKRLMVASQDFGHGDLSVRVDDNMPEPFKTLATNFNTMVEDIRRAMVEQEVMTHAISHELRTPLNRLRFALDMTRDAKSQDDIYSLIDEVDQSAEALDELIGKILELAKINFHTRNQHFTDIPLDQLLLGLLQVQATNPGGKALSLLHTLPVTIVGDTFQLQRVFNNLLDNARKHSESLVTMDMWCADGYVHIVVDDDGAGIPEAQRSQVFVPFSRLDSSRNRKTGGHGLGLAIVESIVRGHGGKVEVADSPYGGARFQVSFPLAQ